MRCMKCMEEISNSQICPHCGYDTAAEPTNKQYLAPGTELSEKYMVGADIGSGGFGVTYAGWDVSLNRKVAIKEYFPSNLSTRIPGQTAIAAFSGEKQMVFNHGKERFIEEAKILMQFTDEEGIVSVYDVLEANGTAYMVMEYVEGITMQKNIDQFGKIPEKQLLDLIVPMLLSLKKVHNAGLAHRDISPDNIMCQPDGGVKLLDFGAARYAVMEESKSLSVIVKRGYTPLEQHQSHGKQGPFTDIYAVGATMYKALTGITPDGSLERMGKDTLKSPSQYGVKITENTENAILAALNIQPKDRPQDIDEFLAILTGEQKGGLIAKKRNKKGIIAAVAAALAVTLGGTALVWSLLNQDTEQPSVVSEDPTITVVPNAISKVDYEAEVLFNNYQLGMFITGGRLYDADMIEQGYIEENLVVSQDPISGDTVKINSSVGVEVSKGKKKEYIPSVTDQLAENALHDFEKYGFGDDFEIQLNEEYSDSNMVGTVISQSLPEDAEVDFDGQITLTISLGRKDPLTSVSTVKVGDYTGKDFDALKRELLTDDVYLVKSASVYSTEYPYGAIITQSPEAGSEIQSGGAVYVITSLGLEMARVPDVRFMDIESAKNALMEKGLSWEIKYVVNPAVSHGLVVEQEIEPGIKTPFETTIELCVSADSEGSEEVDYIDIDITPDTVQLPENETEKLSCSYTGDEDIIWASSNTYIADVDANGLVTGKNFGSVTITAAVGGNIASAMVTVTDDSTITELENYVLTVGESVSLASAIPDAILPNVVWRSSYPSVATVDENGNVTAINEGYTSIAATYKDTTTACGIVVNKKIEYIKIPKEALFGKLSTAKQALKSNGIEYDVVDEYSSKISQGNVCKVEYVGYSDNDSFYISVGSKVTLRHSLGKNTVQSITVKNPPNKVTYFVGETPDYTGMVLTAEYKDGTTKDISAGYTTSPSTLRSVGENKITISYENQSTSIKLTANPIAVSWISVTPASLSCTVGESKTLTVTVYPTYATDTSVYATSSDSSVVKVNGLTLTALKAGTATITVKSNNGKTATCTVTVKNPVTPVQTPVFSISSTKLALTVGETRQLKVTGNTQNKALTWKSSNSRVVRVDNAGNLTALSSGTASITVKASSGVTAVCEVTVTTPIESISLPEEFTALVGHSYSIIPTIKPSNADNQTFAIKVSDPSVLSISGTKVVALKEGVSMVTVTTPNGLSDSCRVTVVNAEAKLTLISKPSKTVYYIGDALDTSGLKLGYTDSSGKYREVTSGFTLSGYDMYSSAEYKVKVKYNDLTVTFNITVQTPSITIYEAVFSLEGRALLTVRTDPADQIYEIWSTDRDVCEISSDTYMGAHIVEAVESGTATIYASMKYNGIEYSTSRSVEVGYRECGYDKWPRDDYGGRE